jgi:hypothetical protein
VEPGKENHVCRLRKSLYGLKQSPKQWYKKFDSYTIEIGYTRCEYDCCAYVKALSLFYEDDMLIAAKSMWEVYKIKSLLQRGFEMKNLAAAMKQILGMEIQQDRKAGRLWLS